MNDRPLGVTADYDGDMPSYPQVEYIIAAFSTKYRRKVKRGPGRGQKRRIKVFISRSNHFLHIDPLYKFS